MTEQKTEQKHTPGPWDVEYDNADSSGGGQWYNAGPAKVWFPYNVKKQEEDEALANARLIAAAPELLEALKAMLDDVGRASSLPSAVKSRAAIVKATGQEADMTDHEKRIREALEAGPTEGPWFEHHDKGHLYIENQRDDVVCDMGLRAKSTPTSQFIAACNPTAIRALLADLDAVRGALKSVQAAIYMDDAGQLRLTRSFDESTIDAALKGASHD